MLCKTLARDRAHEGNKVQFSCGFDDRWKPVIRCVSREIANNPALFRVGWSHIDSRLLIFIQCALWTNTLRCFWRNLVGRKPGV